jgi:uracil-DNA glycosylase family protein
MAVVPSTSSLSVVASACRRCQACPLYRCATQSVFGEGPVHARIMLVGEQPGDEEDRRGHPFVGPAGGVLAEALAEAGLTRDEIYLTNAVKHFKFVEQGKRRLHEKPNARERAACRPWLAAELRLVRPRVVVALGATAAASLMGPSVRVLRDRGQLRPLTSFAGASDQADEAMEALVTLHPSAVLRGPTPERRRELRAWLVADLRLVAERAVVGTRHRATAQVACR